MIRRTLAVAGVVALAIGFPGLAGSPAAADSDIIVQAGDFKLNEVAVDLDRSGPIVEGAYGEIEGFNAGTENLSGLELRGCNTTSDFTIVEFTVDDTINPSINDFFLVASNDYNGPVRPDLEPGTFGSLNPSDSGMYLAVVATGDVINGVRWGSPTACPTADLASASSPSTTQSLDFDGSSTWSLITPDPQSQTGA